MVIATAKKSKVVEIEQTEAQKNSAMNGLMSQVPLPPKEGDTVEGPVVNISNGRIYIDLAPFGTGIIYGREYLSARDVLKNTHIGDVISAKVIMTENAEGYTEVSLREARQAMIWLDVEAALQKKTVLELVVKDANKGGLLVEWQGIAGFLPASQLGTEHYPRVADGDKDRIFAELKKLIGEKVSVIVITADPKEGKLIFSEKHHGESHTPTHSETTSIDKRNLSVGDEFMGEVTGATDFGIFVSIGGGVEGLVHISEMDWGLVEDAKSLYRVGDKVKVKIIEIKDNKVSLSIKALKDNPWVMASKKYKKGDTVNAVVIKYNQYGALASIEEGVAGLVHFSEFGTIQDLRTHLKLGNLYPFSISVFDPDSRKMTLTTGRKKEEKSEEKSEEAPAETVAA